MNIYIMYSLIIILTIILFIIIKDKIKALRLTGIITISSSLSLLVLVFILKLVVTKSITSINISIIADYLFIKFASMSIILFVLGLLEILISKYIYNRKKYNKNTSTI